MLISVYYLLILVDLNILTVCSGTQTCQQTNKNNCFRFVGGLAVKLTVL